MCFLGTVVASLSLAHDAVESNAAILLIFIFFSLNSAILLKTFRETQIGELNDKSPFLSFRNIFSGISLDFKTPVCTTAPPT